MLYSWCMVVSTLATQVQSKSSHPGYTSVLIDLIMSVNTSNQGLCARRIPAIYARSSSASPASQHFHHPSGRQLNARLSNARHTLITIIQRTLHRILVTTSFDNLDRTMAPTFWRVQPSLPVTSIPDSIQYYTKVLGFRVAGRDRDDHTWLQIANHEEDDKWYVPVNIYLRSALQAIDPTRLPSMRLIDGYRTRLSIHSKRRSVR